MIKIRGEIEMDIVTKEIWRTVIVNGEVYKNYMVSNLGNLKSLNYRHTGKERILNSWKNKDNYLTVTLCKDGKAKTCKVHKLVAEAFIPKIDGKTHVDHIDGNRSNNVYTNLRYCTPKENHNFELCRKHKSEAHIGEKSYLYGKTGALHHRSKTVICIELNKIYGSTHEAERELGIKQSSISLCCNGKYKSAGGDQWKYVE